MKILALVLLLFPATAAEGRHVSQTSMGGDIEVRNAPHGATLRTMGGDIRVDSARGRVIAKTMGGNIEVDELRGSLDAGTLGGNVEVEVVEGTGSIEISSVGGHIDITLPASFSGTFDVEIEQDEEGRDNEIVSDFPLDIKESMKNHWFRPDAPMLRGKGVAGSGMHRVKLTTIGGNIRIRKK